MILMKKDQLKEHDVFEFQRGQFLGSHWLNNSVYLSDDTFQEAGLSRFFSDCANFSCYGLTLITQKEWVSIKNNVEKNGSQMAKAIIEELDEWAADCFHTEGCFTVCGI